jgi:hypothetical protein
MTTVFEQPDLFGEYDARQAEAERLAAEQQAESDRIQAERAEYRARFERHDFPAPYDTADGRPKGTIIHGWVCPACGDVEWNEFLLSLNHGYDPGLPGSIPGSYAGAAFGDTCTKQISGLFRPKTSGSL